MKLDLKRIAAATGPVAFTRWPRIFPVAHAATPTNADFGTSRFSSPSRTFRVLYAAQDFPAAFAEAVVRDRFVEKERRYLYKPHLEALVVAEISTRRPLRLVDLTGSAAYDLGIDTDAKGARAHGAGQRFAEALHAGTTVDGILFTSRLTDAACVAVFDRAFPALTAPAPVALLRAKALPAEIMRLGIIVRPKRAV